MRNTRVGGKRANEERSEHLLSCFTQPVEHGRYSLCVWDMPCHPRRSEQGYVKMAGIGWLRL